MPTREIVQVVEIKQPFCNNVFNSSPCAATGNKCYNTRATCKDTDNFDLGYKSLYFTQGRIADRGIDDLYLIPSLKSVSTSPTRINPATSNKSAQGLGNRAVCTIQLQDHPHTDRYVDPYVDTRNFRPYKRGSFWTKWLARNKYRNNLTIKVFEGYEGQSLGQMTNRTYFMQSITGPSDAGGITITGKDILVKIEERKSQAPVVSPGELYTDINNSQTTITITNAVISEYSPTGTIRIDDEIMTYSSITEVNGRLNFTVTRATDNTKAEEHNAEELVQECLRISGSVNEVLTKLLVDYGHIPIEYIDSAGWTAEVEQYLNAYNLSALITTPESVTKLVSEIQEQSLCYIWWDERDVKIKLKAIRGVDIEPVVINDKNHIVAGSFSLSERPKQRVSQIWIYYKRDKYNKKANSPEAYAQSHIVADLESETDVLYGEPSIRKIYARWLPTVALVQNTASKIMIRYVDVPRVCSFTLDAKDRTLWTADTIAISHYLDVNQYGNRQIHNWTITSAEEVMPGELIRYTAEDTTIYGLIYVILPGGNPDWQGDGSDQRNGCFIGNAYGKLSDGTNCGRIT